MKENKKLEYKQEITDSFLKTVSAFANYDGGQIVFGVRDDGAIVGLEGIDAQCLMLENKINDSISPNPDYSISVDRKNRTITLDIQRGTKTPYYYKRRAYKRNDTSTIEVDGIELNRLILRGANLHYEDIRSNNQSLSFDYLARCMRDKLGVEVMNSDILKTLMLLGVDNIYNRAALILSDQNDMRGIDIARFGESINIFLDRATLESGSLLKVFDEAIEVFEKYYSYEEVIGTERKKKYTVPPEAYKEALANAVVHRSWDIEARVRVSMFDDRIEISSPGGLPYGLSEEEYLNGQVSVFRNPIISNVFFRLGIIENFRTGILRIKQAYEDTQAKPEFKVYENAIIVTLPTINQMIATTSDERIVVDYLSGNRIGSSSEISSAIGFSKSKTIQLLNSLVGKGLIAIEGRGRGTKYRKK